jgi:hypothetical protein
MADRRSINSDTYEDPVIEDAQVGLKADARALKQLSSSADAARAKRTQKSVATLDAAIVDGVVGSKSESKQDGTGK